MQFMSWPGHNKAVHTCARSKMLLIIISWNINATWQPYKTGKYLFTAVYNVLSEYLLTDVYNVLSDIAYIFQFSSRKCLLCLCIYFIYVFIGQYTLS